MAGENPANNNPQQDTGSAPETTQEVNTVGKEQPESTDKPEMTVEDYQKALHQANREAAKYRAQRNELREDAQKYRELKESEMTELEKLTKAKEDAEAKVAAMEHDLKLVQVLREYGISDENVDLLGDDPAKFEQRASKLQVLQEKAARRLGPPSDYPVENLKPGASSTPEVADDSYPASWRVVGQFIQK